MFLSFTLIRYLLPAKLLLTIYCKYECAENMCKRQHASSIAVSSIAVNLRSLGEWTSMQRAREK